MGLIRTPFSLETPSRMRNYRRFFTARARVAVYDALRDKKRTLPAHTVLWPCVSLVYKIYISEFVGGEKKTTTTLPGAHKGLLPGTHERTSRNKLKGSLNAISA